MPQKKKAQVAFGQKQQQPNVALNTGAPAQQGAQAAPSTNPGEDCLKKLAEVASAKSGLKIAWASQRDSSRMMKGAAIHPLQPLENIHQHLVRAAGRAASLKDQLEKEQEALDGFYISDASEPELFLPHRDKKAVVKPLVDTAFNEAVETISTADRALIKLADTKADASKLKVLKDKLKEAIDQLEATRKAFPTEDPPLLKDAKTKLDKVGDAISGAADWAALRKVLKERVMPAALALDDALSGIARVQMFYDIDAFYLFRLLVRYKVESDKEITEEIRKKASGELTGILNNQRNFLIKFLKEKLVTIAKALSGDKDVFFHLKGGRALAYLLRTPEAGENDWDTTIVINPNLPAAEWYAKFFEVHDLMLRMLKDFKREFFALIHKNHDAFMQSLGELPKPPLEVIDEAREMDDEEDERVDRDRVGDEPEEALFAKVSADCKAELIDIGVPRRDTVEAFEQWLHTRQRLIGGDFTDYIPIPSHLYHIDEYVIMVREVLAGVSQSPGKSAKRIRRLYDILGLQVNGDKLDDNIAAERAHIPKDLLLKSLALVDKQSRPVKNMLTVLLKQFAETYEVEDQGAKFAAIVDGLFAGQKPDKLPDEIQKSIKEDPKFKQEHTDLLGWISGSKAVADQLRAHARKRAEFFGFGVDAKDAQKQRRTLLTRFIKAFYTQYALTQQEGEELEVQLAVTGSYAAYLHADYRDLSVARAQEFEPVSTIELKFFCHDPNVDPHQVYETFIDAPLQKALGAMQQDQRFTTEEAMAPRPRLLLYWPKEEIIEGLTYAPLSIRVTLVRDAVWPQLAFIWGLPVLSLRDLIREYDQRSAEVEEFGARQELRKTSTRLKEMLTEYDSVPVRAIVETPK